MGVDMEVSGIHFRLKADHDFSFLDEWDSVCRVFDRQDSGNLCFGVVRDGERFFIKYAGAETLNYQGEAVGGVAGAVFRLREASHIFRTLAHPALVELVDSGEMGAGYGLVFRWREGDSLRIGFDFDAHPEYGHSLPPDVRFRALPLDKKLKALDEIFSFHEHVAALQYVAVDFYDGSLMYDFERDALTICDIDLYQKSPFVNDMGRLWGSSRFMAPEEFTKGATIDELTNVFTMGATALELLGTPRSREKEDFHAPDGLFRVAKRATQNDRAARYPSIRAFREAWDEEIASL